jgi:hypothetical protein
MFPQGAGAPLLMMHLWEVVAAAVTVAVTPAIELAPSFRRASRPHEHTFFDVIQKSLHDGFGFNAVIALLILCSLICELDDRSMDRFCFMCNPIDDEWVLGHPHLGRSGPTHLETERDAMPCVRVHKIGLFLRSRSSPHTCKL